MREMVFWDCEAVGLAQAKLLVKPDARLTDPAKVKASLQEKQDKLATDPLASRIICLGFQIGEVLTLRLCRTEEEEAAALREFWKATVGRVLVGFYCKRYDAPLCLNRSRMLKAAGHEVPIPVLDLNPYKRDRLIDLWGEYTFYGAAESGVLSRSQEVACAMYGIDLPDPLENGAADVPVLWEQGTVEAHTKILAHCTNDVKRTVALAKALGVSDELGW